MNRSYREEINRIVCICQDRSHLLLAGNLGSRLLYGSYLASMCGVS